MIRHRRFYTPINWFLTFAGIFSWPKRKKLQKRLALSVCEANLHILMNQEMEMYCFIISHSNAKSPLDLYQLEPWAWLGLKNSPLQKFFPLVLVSSQKKGQNWQLLIILFLGREIIRLPLRDEFCISKNMAVISCVCRTGPCFCFFDFLSFYAKL